MRPIAPRRLMTIVAMVALCSAAGCAARAPASRAATPPGTGPATGPAVRRAAGLDADTWARRNIELLRWAVGSPRGAKLDMEVWFGFSLQFNPMLKRDPYAGEVLPLYEAYLAKAGDKGRELRVVVEWLRRPEAERLLPPDGRDWRDATGARGRPPTPTQVADAIMTLPPDLRVGLTPKLIERMESAARERGDWDRLGAAYQQLARDAVRRGEAGPAGRYFDRLGEVLREHPVVQEPGRGNQHAVDPVTLAELMIDAGRRPQLEALIESVADGDARAELWVGLIGGLAGRGDFHWPAVVIERRLRPLRPEAADRLAAALRGEVRLPPPPEDPAERIKRPPAEARLRRAIESVANGFAARGDVETAGRMLVALRRDSVGAGELAPSAWGVLARSAADNGYAAAAREGYERAVAAMARGSDSGGQEPEEEARLVRKAASIGDHETALEVLRGGPDGPYAHVRLARAYRRLGEPEKARAQLDQALAEAYEPDRTAGSAMAAAAVELQALGDGERAGRVLLDSLVRISGVDFGFGGTSDVVSAAVEMRRVELLDALYEKSGPSGKLLLCLVASRHAVHGFPEEED